MKYLVKIFPQPFEYEIEAEDQLDAEDEALRKLHLDSEEIYKMDTAYWNEETSDWSYNNQ